jgi:hypothetical protein
MNAAARKITPADILPPEIYAAERNERRAALRALKQVRRVPVGPYATFYFENYHTMWLQVHEMLHTERGGAAQLPDELAAYNPLIPQGQELVATLMYEIEDPVRRLAILRQLTNVEEKVFIQIGAKRIFADPEHDVERTASDGKTSSVHFLHFRFTPDEIAVFKAGETPVVVGIAHQNYGHMAVLAPEIRAALAKDFA